MFFLQRLNIWAYLQRTPLMEKIKFCFLLFYGTCGISMRLIIEFSSYVVFDNLIKQSLLPNRVKSFTKIYETIIDFFFMVVDIFIC